MRPSMPPRSTNAPKLVTAVTRPVTCWPGFSVFNSACRSSVWAATADITSRCNDSSRSMIFSLSWVSSRRAF